jgi:hypothetical protein
VPPAPTVQNLQDIIGQITAAQAPEQSQIDSNISSNETSGAGQVAGLDAAKTNAFNTIEQNANNKGMYFSGFSPNAEATYTGSTYLPALAKLQATIANTRNTLLGQKANLVTQANTQALTTQQGEQKELDAYNSQQASLAQQRQLQAEAEAATAKEDAANRANALAVAGTKAGTAISGYGITNVANGGGLQVHGPNGQPISVGAYLDAISGGQAGTKDVAQILAGSNSTNDQKIAKAIGNMTTAQAQKAYPWLFE